MVRELRSHKLQSVAKKKKGEEEEREKEENALEIMVTSFCSKIVSVIWKWLIVDFSPLKSILCLLYKPQSFHSLNFVSKYGYFWL